MIKKIKSIEDNVDCDKLSFMGSNKKVYGLKDICRKIMTIEEAEIKQNKFAEKLDELRAYPAMKV